MKKYLALSVLFLAGFGAVAQPAKPSDALAITAGGTFGKPKVVPGMKRMAITQFSVDFKQATTVAVTKQEKQFSGFGKTPGKAATGSVTAYLETTDGELSHADFQEIADYGYQYFQKALAKAGYDTVGWEKIAASDFYKEGKEEEADERGQEQSAGQWWTRANAFSGNTLYKRGAAGFAFGKGKRAIKFAEELDAATAYFNLTVDFADILVDVDVKTTGYKSTWTPSYNTIGRTTKMSSKTSVAPMAKIPLNGSWSIFYNAKAQAESLTMPGQIPAEFTYHDAVTEDPDRAKKRSSLFSVSFSKRLESTPVVISTTREKYKAAAKKALEAFADAFVAKARELKKA